MRPFKLAAILAGTVGLILIGFLAIGFLLPSTWQTEQSAHVEAAPIDVFRHLDSARAWEEWTPSPETGVEYFGPDAGEGSGRRWDDPGYGSGEFRITRSDPPTLVEYRVEVEGGSIQIQGRLILEPEDAGTRIRWAEQGDFGRNPLLGYLAGRMEEMQGEQLAVSLQALRELVEGEG